MSKKITMYRNPSQPTYEQCDSRREDRRFYASTQWRKVRAIKLAMNPLCECPDNCGLIAEEVHHRLDRKQRPDLALYLDNLQSLTTSCHSRITAARLGKACFGPNDQRIMDEPSRSQCDAVRSDCTSKGWN
jgi:5-methylcytosine-specific restriction endonuclease McrA